MRTLDYCITAGEEGWPLLRVLQQRLHLSRHCISSLKFSEGILLDGQQAHTGVRVRAGQRASVCLRDAAAALEPCHMPLRVLWQDEDVLVVDKPAPLPSIGSVRQAGATLENALYAYLGCPEGFVYRPVSRLDKGTSGLMPVAMNAHAHDRMQRRLHSEEHVRIYLAVTEGAPREDEGVIDLPIGHAEGVKRCVDAHGKPARTYYTVLRRAKNARALVRLRLETGRTHQIRVHMQALGCPVAGDYLYGTELKSIPGRFALHAAQLSFAHPVTEEMLRFESPLPPELEALLNE